MQEKLMSIHKLPKSGRHILGRFMWFKGTLSHFNRTFLIIVGFPGGSDGKESACNAGDLGSIPGLGRSPGGGHDNPCQYSFLEYPHGQRSLVG